MADYQIRRTIACGALVLAAACGAKTPPVLTPVIKQVETQIVQVPVPTPIPPPAELLTAATPALPVFVAPSDPQASSALTPEGERALQALVEDLLSRLAAWKAWATTPPPTP